MKRNLFLFSLVALCLSAACINENRTKQTGEGKNKLIEPETKSSSSVKIQAIKVYIENSSSMDGYVNGTTEFEQTIYNYLSDIKISGITDSLNLLYINSDAIPYASAASSDVIADFIDKLEPNTFKRRGGNRGTSDIANVFKLVLSETKKNEIAILVTDGIFSPGKSKDAAQYLTNQEVGIKTTFAEHLKINPDMAVMMYQLFSNFNGIYFNKDDIKSNINEQRPYYIWIFGQTKNITSLRCAVPEKKFNGKGVAKMYSIVSGNQEIDYSIKVNSGDFDISRKKPKTEIQNLAKDSRLGKVRFAINANFDNLLLDEKYLTNPEYYEYKNYELTVKRNDNKSKYSHSLNFTADKVRNGELAVKLKTHIPKWVEEINDDSGITAVSGKTYGIKHQINGIHNAFTNKTDYYTEIKINIK